MWIGPSWWATVEALSAVRLAACMSVEMKQVWKRSGSCWSRIHLPCYCALGRPCHHTPFGVSSHPKPRSVVGTDWRWVLMVCAFYDPTHVSHYHVPFLNCSPNTGGTMHILSTMHSLTFLNTHTSGPILPSNWAAFLSSSELFFLYIS